MILSFLSCLFLKVPQRTKTVRLYSARLKVRRFCLQTPLLGIILACGACTSYQTRIGRENWVATMAASALTNGEISYKTRQFLVENAIDEDYEESPDKTIANLSECVQDGSGATFVFSDYGDVRPVLNVLIELCMKQALESDGEEAIKYWTSCNFYAFKLLFDPSLRHENSNSDYLSEVAALRYYNISASYIFSYFSDKNIPFMSTRELPSIFGKVIVQSSKSELLWNPDSFEKFIVAFDYIPSSLNSHSYVSGAGVPLVGTHDEDFMPSPADRELVFLQRAYPITFLIRYENFSTKTGSVEANFEFYNDFKTEKLAICGIEMPPTKDFSIMLSSMLDKNRFFKDGLLSMLRSDRMGDLEGLYLLSPYDENKIPVVFVHGLMSAPRTWTQVINTLLASAEIRQNYQFWLFAYPTGQPVYYTASELRKSLLDMKKKYDADNKNPKFSRMIIVGHSMGGLVSRLMTLDSGGEKLADELLKLHSVDKKFSDLKLSESEKEFFSEILVFESLPFVKRVIFLATPHKGSEIAEWSIAKFGSSIISLPTHFAEKSRRAFKQIAVLAGNDAARIEMKTSIDNLDPNSPFVKSYNALESPGNVSKHSVIGDQDEAGKKDGSDGVVPYWSSHVPDAQSEIVLKSGHNVHTKPQAAKEIRRIMIEHLKEK